MVADGDDGDGDSRNSDVHGRGGHVGHKDGDGNGSIIIVVVVVVERGRNQDPQDLLTDKGKKIQKECRDNKFFYGLAPL